MAKPHIVGLREWNEMAEVFSSESDRGAAILAGSFAEHALGTFLTRRVKDKKIAEKLFGSVGPLSSFSQRIAVAYAFDLISPAQYKDLELVRQARNHFAHHPLEATFAAPEVQKHTSHLSFFKEPAYWEQTDLGAMKHREAYLSSCGVVLKLLLRP